MPVRPPSNRPSTFYFFGWKRVWANLQILETLNMKTLIWQCPQMDNFYYIFILKYNKTLFSCNSGLIWFSISFWNKSQWYLGNNSEIYRLYREYKCIFSLFILSIWNTKKNSVCGHLRGGGCDFTPSLSLMDQKLQSGLKHLYNITAISSALTDLNRYFCHLELTEVRLSYSKCIYTVMQSNRNSLRTDTFHEPTTCEPHT